MLTTPRYLVSVASYLNIETIMAILIIVYTLLTGNSMLVAPKQKQKNCESEQVESSMKLSWTAVQMFFE